MASMIDLSGALARVLGSMRNPTGGAGTANPIRVNDGGLRASMGVPSTLRSVADRVLANAGDNTTLPLQANTSNATALSPIDGIGFSQVVGTPGNRSNLQNALGAVLSRNAQRNSGLGIFSGKKGKLGIGS